MKHKFIISAFITLFLLQTSVLAEDWDNFADLDNAWDGQKTITNKEFEQVIDAMQEKTKKKEAKQRKKKIKKVSGGGTSLHDELNPDNTITELQSLKTAPEELLINLPVNLIIDGKTIEKGFYNVTAQRDENKKIFLNLYQAHYLIARVEAQETEEDFNEENVDFANVKFYNDSFVKIIFGSVDFNAFAYVPYINQ